MEQTFDPSAFDRLAAAEPGHFWFEERRTLLLWALRHYFPAARNFCEVGCGTGFFLAGLAQCRPELRLTGVDYYSEALAHARHRLPGVTLELGDILKADRSGSFDVVGCFDVLEHIPDDINALAALATRLRPGGGLLLTVPQHPSLWSVADEIGHHQRRYRREELVRKVHTAGLGNRLS
jgi:SAM-dependent methyltransferase